MKIITDSAKLNEAISQLANSKIDATIQRLLVSAFYHRMISGDNTFISKVLDAMPRGSRVKAAEKYVAAFFNVEVVKVKGVYGCTNTFKYRNEVNQEDLDAAAAVMWWEFKPAKKEEEYSREAQIEKLQTAIDKAMKAAKAAGDREFMEALADLDLPS